MMDVGEKPVTFRRAEAQGVIHLTAQVFERVRAGTAPKGNVLALAAFISVNVAVVNLLPIPALDGGRLFLLGIEAAARRSAPRLAVQLLNTLGIALIVFLMITVTYHDIGRLLV